MHATDYSGSDVHQMIEHLKTLNFTYEVKLRASCNSCSRLVNLLEPELFFFILAHPVYKMLIIWEPNMLEL